MQITCTTKLSLLAVKLCLIIIVLLVNTINIKAWAYGLYGLRTDNIIINYKLLTDNSYQTYDYSELFYVHIISNLDNTITITDKIRQSCTIRNTKSTGAIYYGKWDPGTKRSYCVTIPNNSNPYESKSCIDQNEPLYYLNICSGKYETFITLKADEWKNIDYFYMDIYNELSFLNGIGCNIPTDMQLNDSVTFSGSYTYKIDCQGPQKIRTIKLIGEPYGTSDLLINGVGLLIGMQ